MSPIGRATRSARSIRTLPARTSCSGWVVGGCLCFVGASFEAAAVSRPPDGVDASTREEQIERALDQIAASEDAVPPRWWRLLYEYRAHAAADPAAWAELAALERRCRELVARQIEGFGAAFGTAFARPPIELAELGTALTDGLRAAHAEGRSTMTSGEGLRLVVKGLIALSERTETD
jgi:hypothetical protein